MARSLARIDARIFQAIWDKARETQPKITKIAIYKRVESVRTKFKKIISARMAANVLAAEMGVDIQRFLKDKPEELKETRELLGLASQQPRISTQKEKKQDKEQLITISRKITESFGLPQNLRSEASRMSDVYPMMYVLENLVRYVVMDKLVKIYGADWWNRPNIVSNDIKRKVEERKRQEGASRWHYKRGSHEIFYTNFGDLSAIISTNWSQFKPLFNKLSWIQAKLEEVELSRNIIAHNNPLPKREFDRIKMCLEDLQRQLGVYVEKKRQMKALRKSYS